MHEKSIHLVLKELEDERLPDGAKLAVRVGDYNVPQGAFMGFGTGDQAKVFSLALNPLGAVTIGEETIPVKPAFGDLGDGTEPFALDGGTAAVTVKAIPGLLYSLLRGETLLRGGDAASTGWEPVASETATSTRVTLTDTEPPPEKAFYVIDAAKP